MEGAIHIVEPTLRDQTGHCYSHVDSLAQANEGLNLELEVWGGKGASELGLERPGTVVHGYYNRRWRRLQSPMLYRQLLKGKGRIYLPTGNRTELAMINFALMGKAAPAARVFLLFHWLKLNDRKRAYMQKLAAKHDELVMMAPTEGVKAALVECGFKQCHVVPYPISPAAPAGGGGEQFRHLLFAGAARADKGFEHLVSFVKYLAEQGSDLPVVMQVSTPHSGVHEPRVEAALTALKGIDYGPLEWVTKTLDEEEYRGLYEGAICLQPYDREEYAGDRISGVTLDALSNGSPIITTSGTWMSRVVERFDAGLALDEFDAAGFMGAVDQIRGDFGEWRSRAVHAGAALQDENDGGRLLRFIAEYGDVEGDNSLPS